MKHTSIRARVAVGSAVVAIAGFAGVGHLSAAPETAPPSTEPVSSEPAGSGVELDPEREALVDQLVAAAAADDFPLDRDCVAGLLAEVPDDELQVIVQQIEAEAAAMDVGASYDTLAVGTMSVGSEPAETLASETAPLDTEPVEPVPSLSPETEAIALQMVACASGDADPALVADALAVIQADPEAPQFDMACVEAVLSTFSDDTLTMLIDEAAAPPAETAASATAASAETAAAGTTPEASMAPETTWADVSLPDDETFAQAMTLLLCSPEFMDEMASGSLAPDSAAPVETTIGSEPVDTGATESTGP